MADAPAYTLYQRLPGLVLGFHGCDREIGEKILRGDETHPSPTDLRGVYYEGFMASGEGWNGEYPFQDGGKDPRLDEHWCQKRDNAVEALKGKQ